jgi:hypothetical protein
LFNKATLVGVGIVSAAVLLSGCLGALQTVQTAGQMYSGSRGAYQAYHSTQTVKAIKKAEPVFAEYERVNLDVKVRPRDSEEAREITAAFKDNLRYVVRKDLKAAELGVETCLRDCPTNGGLVLQFKEKGYDDGVVQSLLAGDKMRGTLYFVDGEDGSVIKEEPIENAEDYKGLMKLVHMSVYTKALKSAMKGKSNEEAKALMKRAQKKSDFPLVRPKHQDLLASR